MSESNKPGQQNMAARIMGGDKGALRAPEARHESMSEMFNRVALLHGKTTIAQKAEGGAWMVWITPHEVDPMKALLSAALTILAARGTAVDPSKGISIRKVMLSAPGAEFYWQVTDTSDQIIASGYAATEKEASDRIAEHVAMPTKAVAADAHDLYADGDKDIPDVICDSNGQAVLSLCKKCGQAEGTLEAKCPGGITSDALSDKLERGNGS